MKYNVEKMIAELCPTGVLYCEMGKLAQIGTGKSNGNEAEDNGEYPFFIRSPIVKRKNCYEYDEEAIIIPGEGGVGDIFHYINGKYALHQRVYRIHFTTKDVDTRFMYYYLSANFKVFIQRKAVNATVTSIRKPMIEQFPIPLPPLPIQQEIVRILDTFTNLTAELTAELTARRKQYEYYRDELLTFGEDVSRVQLGLVCDFKYGKGNNIPNETGEYPVYGCNGIVSTTNTFNSEDAPIIGHIGSAGVVNWGKGKHFVTYNGTICRVKADKIRSRYAYYVLNSLHLERFVKGSQPFLSYGDFSKVLIPLPPIERQDEIVRILDQFDYFCNDLTSGIPAEISARHKQYEYYRDQLLTFKRIGG